MSEPYRSCIDTHCGHTTTRIGINFLGVGRPSPLLPERARDPICFATLLVAETDAPIQILYFQGMTLTTQIPRGPELYVNANEPEKSQQPVSAQLRCPLAAPPPLHPPFAFCRATDACEMRKRLLWDYNSHPLPFLPTPERVAKRLPQAENQQYNTTPSQGCNDCLWASDFAPTTRRVVQLRLLPRDLSPAMLPRPRDSRLGCLDLFQGNAVLVTLESLAARAPAAGPHSGHP